MAQAWVEIHNEVADPKPSGWTLCFQNCTYHYDNDDPEKGYRFIWRRPNGNLQAARGQARIPDAETLFKLINSAIKDGWLQKPVNPFPLPGTEKDRL